VVEHLTPSPLNSTATTSIAVFPTAPTFEFDSLSSADRVLIAKTLDEDQDRVRRSRFESVDSAFPVRKAVQARLGGSLNVSISGGGNTGWQYNEGTLRRGSLGIMMADMGEKGREDGRLRVVSAGEGMGREGHWSDRRGSWAEGWAKD
jgi:hypothetical protein